MPPIPSPTPHTLKDHEPKQFKIYNPIREEHKRKTISAFINIKRMYDSTDYTDIYDEPGSRNSCKVYGLEDKSNSDLNLKGTAESDIVFSAVIYVIPCWEHT